MQYWRGARGEICVAVVGGCDAICTHRQRGGRQGCHSTAVEVGIANLRLPIKETHVARGGAFMKAYLCRHCSREGYSLTEAGRVLRRSKCGCSRGQAGIDKHTH